MLYDDILRVQSIGIDQGNEATMNIVAYINNILQIQEPFHCRICFHIMN